MKRTKETTVTCAKRTVETRRSKRLLASSLTVKSETSIKLEEPLGAPTYPLTPERSSKTSPSAEVRAGSQSSPSSKSFTGSKPSPNLSPYFNASPDEPKLKVEFEDSVPSKADAEVPPNVFPPYLKELGPKQPANWISIYNEIVRMRALIETPVDSMGCGRMPTSLTNNSDVSDRRTYRFQLLVALMLSSQTKDEVNFAAIGTLHEHYRSKGFKGLCLDAMLELSEEEIDKCIAKVGFHRRKALYLKKTCDILKSNFGSDIPKTIEDVVSLPGVGPKMGHLLLQNGWDINLGIGVDVHIHRLAQMWGWVPKSDKPEVTRSALEGWLPRECWADINPLLVGFGQSVCAIKANNCDVCTLSEGLCKSANKKLAKTELTEKRIEKLMLQRGNLSGLIALRAERDAKALDFKPEKNKVKSEDTI